MFWVRLLLGVGARNCTRTRSLRPVNAPPQPDPFVHTFTNLVAARAVIGATEIGLFDALAEGEATPAETPRVRLHDLSA